MVQRFFKVTFLGKNSHRLPVYFPHKLLAQSYVSHLDSDVSTMLSCVTMMYHHTSLTKGYVRKYQSYRESYIGKFGKGFKLHIENCERKVSNSYHFVEYYVES